MQQLDLSGLWTLSDQSGEHRCSAVVPGTCHGALVRAELIPNPYHQRNEADLQWIGERTWTWTRQFEVSPQLLAERRIELCCDGLDTLATIHINDHIIGDANNMHRRWRFNAKPALSVGTNTITITCASVMPVIRERYAERPLRGTKCIAHEPLGRGYIRKEQSNFGWDWGPVLITNGIYRNIRLEARSQPALSRPLVTQQHHGGKVTLNVQATINGKQNGLRAVVTVRDGRRIVSERSTSVTKGAVAAKLNIPEPKLWWPNTMGKQPLYTLTVQLIDGESVIDEQQLRLGLRTIELRRRKDRWGESFLFVVNGRRFFAKGACWIPADAIKDNATPAVYDRLLGDMADANMNMVRIWGGGYFERDYFYERCDELGLLIWHDFMFACAAYPGDDPDFRANVRAEIRDQVQHLRHHPAIALWCGNNELEMGIAKSNSEWPRMPMKWYSKIFDQEIPKILASEDPQRDYWPCSPHSPIGKRDDHNHPDWGNAHLWNVWHGKEPFEWYRTSFHRFCTEFGFQSFPEPKTVAGFTESTDRYLNSPVMEWHQRSGIGNTTIMQYLLSWFPMPDSFEHTLWMSQLVQAMAITYAVEHWRRNMPRCMGAVYWQINDNWPVASWSSIDYHGNWKALHYAAKRFFAPLLLSAVEDENQQCIDLHLTSDSDNTSKLTITWELRSTAGTVVANGTARSGPTANGSSHVLTIDCSEALTTHGPEHLLMFAHARRGKTVVARTWSAFRKPKALSLRKPGLKKKISVYDDRVQVSVSCKRPALFVMVSHAQHQFVADDNFLMLAPDEDRIITLTPRGCTPQQLARGLQVQSLTDLVEPGIFAKG